MIIYAYSLVFYPNLIKIGQTVRDAESRIKEQLSILPEMSGLKPYKVLYKFDTSVYGITITDREVHRALKKYHVSKEWFNCDIKTLDKALRNILKKKCNVSTDKQLNIIKEKVKASNKIEPKKYMYKNELLTVREISEKYEIKSDTLYHRIYRTGKAE